MNIVVCVKQVPDPETPPSSFKIDTATNRVVPAPGVPPVISPFDEHAVEAALRIKDVSGAKVTVISMGKDLVMDVVKKPLSMGADELILLQDEAFEGGDSYTTAYALSTAIKKIGQFDLIFCGRQAADWDVGQVGMGIAELLGIPSVAPAKKVEVLDGRVKVERVVPDGYEVIEAPTPVLVTISNELGEPRYATMKGIMAAARKKPTIWTSKDIGADAAKIGKAGSKIKLLKLFIPVREVKCVMAEGESIEEAAADLALKLRAAKVI